VQGAFINGFHVGFHQGEGDLLFETGLFLERKKPEGNSEETVPRREEQNRSYLRSGCKGVEEIRERNLRVSLSNLQYGELWF